MWCKLYLILGPHLNHGVSRLRILIGDGSEPIERRIRICSLGLTRSITFHNAMYSSVPGLL